MIFVLRALFVSLGVFATLYCVASLLVVGGWHLWRLLRGPCRLPRPSFLFGLRLLPLVGSGLVTLLFALPAFLLLEKGFDEDFGTFVFSGCCLLMFGAGFLRVWIAQAKGSRLATAWLDGANPLPWKKTQLLLQPNEGVAPLVLIGVLEPKVLISPKAASLLSDDELEVAIRHELGHIRSRDNLKKMIMHGLPFPGMASLDLAWQEATEFAADDAAVSNRCEAVDLAAALLKVAELIPLQEPPVFTTALVNPSAIVEHRVQHLLQWSDLRLQKARFHWHYILPLVGASTVYLATHYVWALLLTHKATEWFIH